MKLLTHLHAGQAETGALTERGVLRLQAAHLARHGVHDPRLHSLLAFLQGGVQARHDTQDLVAHSVSHGADDLFLRPEGLQWLAPVQVPESIREFMNFEQHVINCARKFGMPAWRRRLDEWVERRFGRQHTLAYRSSRPWYDRPVYYKGNRFSVVGHNAAVQIPHYTRVFDYELEFGVFLCGSGRNLRPEDVPALIGGYVVFNDFSARDIQGREMGGRLGPSKGKDFDTGNAMGPYLVTPDEVPEPYALAMSARINGETVSLGNSADMRFRFEQIIAYISQAETLYPGEFFGSGTCSGAQGMGCGVEHGRFLKAGDVIELEVQGLGVLRNTVVAAPADARAVDILPAQA